MRDRPFYIVGFLTVVVLFLMAFRDIEVMGVKPLEIMTVPILGCWLIYLIATHKRLRINVYLLKAVIPIAFWILVTGLVSEMQGTLSNLYLYQLNIARLLICFAIGYLFFAFVKHYGQRALMLVTYGILAVALLLSVQFFVSVWQHGLKLNIITFYNSNYYASFLLIPTVVCIVLPLAGNNSFKVKAVFLCTGVLLVFQLAMTISRGAIIGLGVALIFALTRTLFSRGRRIAVLYFILLTIGMLAVITQGSDLLIENIENLAFLRTLEQKSGLESSRWEVWKAALMVIASYPIFGIGLGQGPYGIAEIKMPTVHILAATEKMQQAHATVAHNLFLELAILGGIPMLAIVGVVFFRMYRGFQHSFNTYSQHEEQNSGLYLAWESVVVANLSMSLTLNYLVVRHLWMLIGLGYGLKQRLTDEPMQ
jgi:O-antigen ligase